LASLPLRLIPAPVLPGSGTDGRRQSWPPSQPGLPKLPPERIYHSVTQKAYHRPWGVSTKPPAAETGTERCWFGVH